MGVGGWVGWGGGGWGGWGWGGVGVGGEPRRKCLSHMEINVAGLLKIRQFINSCKGDIKARNV